MGRQNFVDRWLYRLRGPEPGPIVLRQRRIFVLPTPAGMAFSVALLLMFAGSINYALSLGYLLTFLLAGLGIVAILHSFANLLHLHITPGRCAPVFVGERAEFELLLDNPAERARIGISLCLRDQYPESIDVPSLGTARVLLGTRALKRGWQRPQRITIATRYPLGVIRAWSHIEPDMRCLVYPGPETNAPPLPVPAGGTGDHIGGASGDEDFAGLRGYQFADPPRHIAWKVLARGNTLMTKQFIGQGGASLLLDWHALPAALDTEARLSRLTSWIIEARTRGLVCGLRLPGSEIPPASGDTHYEHCLRTLALHGKTT